MFTFKYAMKEIYNVQRLKSVFVLICAVQIRNIETFHCFVLRRTSGVYVHAWVHQGFICLTFLIH